MSETIKPEDFDFHALSEAEIVPLVSKLYDLCEKYGVPMLVTYGVDRKAGLHQVVTTCSLTPERAPAEFYLAERIASRGVSDQVFRTMMSLLDVMETLEGRENGPVH